MRPALRSSGEVTTTAAAAATTTTTTTTSPGEMERSSACSGAETGAKAAETGEPQRKHIVRRASTPEELAQASLEKVIVDAKFRTKFKNFLKKK